MDKFPQVIMLTEIRCRKTNVYTTRFHLYKTIYSDRNRSVFLAARVRRELWTVMD